MHPNLIWTANTNLGQYLLLYILYIYFVLFKLHVLLKLKDALLTDLMYFGKKWNIWSGIRHIFEQAMPLNLAQPSFHCGHSVTAIPVRFRSVKAEAEINIFLERQAPNGLRNNTLRARGNNLKCIILLRKRPNFPLKLAVVLTIAEAAWWPFVFKQ